MMRKHLAFLSFLFLLLLFHLMFLLLLSNLFLRHFVGTLLARITQVLHAGFVLFAVMYIAVILLPMKLNGLEPNIFLLNNLLILDVVHGPELFLILLNLNLILINATSITNYNLSYATSSTENLLKCLCLLPLMHLKPSCLHLALHPLSFPHHHLQHQRH